MGQGQDRPVPVDELLVLAYDTYWFEREECRPARRCDFVLVNLFRDPVGAPMRPGAVNELLAARNPKPMSASVINKATVSRRLTGPSIPR